ncbi:hypothetical protein F939_00025 [Acinetobacter radioresistens DSM 6976 = NBRC 102413 = CIP 103788]|nr:hypothetical protein F939_00025 [Acinetobacter radioresistens DSM 6976 = NBRC 102413 = CIP 103788]BBL22543.1 hypothetical protein ACRAD_32140 [Acinetobacter radioresistens DSM 6976 = NBRC 102413 = CIP 103788]
MSIVSTRSNRSVESKPQLFDRNRIEKALNSEIHSLPNRKLSIDELDEIFAKVARKK